MSQNEKDKQADQLLEQTVNAGYQFVLEQHAKNLTEGFLIGNSTGVMAEGFKLSTLAQGKCPCGDPNHELVNVRVEISVKRLTKEEYEKERAEKEAKGA